MTKASTDFGKLVKSFLERNNLTFRAAAFGSDISAAYWKDMSDGRVPSEQVITQIASRFDDLDENELRIAAGYGPKMETMDPVKAVEFALRGQKSIPKEGKAQIIEFVRETQRRFSKK
jgi:hypothetical protein